MIPTKALHRLRRFMTVGVSVACAIVLCLPAVALASPSSASLQAQAQAALASRNTMQEELDRASAAYGDALADQHQAEQNASDAQARIDDANQQILKLQDHLSERARSMYRTGSSTMLDFFLRSATIRDVATNWDILTSMNADDTRDVQQSKSLRDEVKNQKNVFDEQTALAKQKADEAKAIKEDAEAKTTQIQANYDSLNAELKQALADEQKAQEQAQAAQAKAAVDNATHNNSYTPSSGGGGPAPAYNAALGCAIVARAQGCFGKPYKWGACGPNEFDCSGLVGYALTGAFARFGTTGTFMGYPTVSDPQPGDICTSSYHCGIYIGGGQMIHAPQDGDVVRVGPVQSDMKIVRHY